MQTPLLENKRSIELYCRSSSTYYPFLLQLLNPVEENAGEDYSNNNLTLFSELRAAEAEWYSYNDTPDATLYIALTSKLYCEWLITNL